MVLHLHGMFLTFLLLCFGSFAFIYYFICKKNKKNRGKTKNKKMLKTVYSMGLAKYCHKYENFAINGKQIHSFVKMLSFRFDREFRKESDKKNTVKMEINGLLNDLSSLGRWHKPMKLIIVYICCAKPKSNWSNEFINLFRVFFPANETKFKRKSVNFTRIMRVKECVFHATNHG